MKKLRGSKTEINLLTAFAGESQARNRYTYFAGQAKKDGFEQIAAIFIETADNEKEHAKVFFKFLEGGEASITASFPAGIIGGTADNLLEAAQGEAMEWGTIYPEFAANADREGFADVARAFQNIGAVEKQHEARYRKLLRLVRDGVVFARPAKVHWKCRNCGYIHEGKEAPQTCPACSHPQAYYEVVGEF